MKEGEWQTLANLKHDEQHGLCGVCGSPLDLDPRTWPRPQLAHRVKRSTVVRELGKEYEWDPRVLTLVCPNTKRGKDCNSGALIKGPVPQQALLDEIRGGSRELARPLKGE